jgi:two-component sensor histidine kinase
MTPVPQPGGMRRASILRRITLMSWLVAVLTVAIFAGFATYHIRRSMTRELEARSDSLGHRIEERISQSMAGRNFAPVVKDCLDLLGSEAGLRYILIRPYSGSALLHYVDSNGQPRWSDVPADAAAAGKAHPGPNEDFQAAPDAAGGRVWHYSQSASSGLNSEGEIALGLSMDAYTDSIHAMYRNIATTGGIVLVVGFAAAFSVARKLIQPLKVLQNFATKVTGGALSTRANVDAAGEIGDLAESMNRMVESLELSNVKLRESMKNSASLREKEILLREIHHRVKNNMQILTSLLRLQTRQADSQELRDVLQESEARIRSMGLLHEKLYQSESVSRIEMHGYLRTLTGELCRVNTPQGTRRDIKLNVHGVFMGLDTALPCGLMITELVTNALKYAFSGRPEGTIYVSLGSTGDGNFQLVVWDDGVGMKEDFDIANATSLGMRLVKMLTDQLNGTLTFDCSQGTRVTITFRESQYEMRI